MARTKCGGCPGLIVPAIIPKGAKIMVFGEYPGVEEVETGIPFTGGTGDVLRLELARVGISLDMVARTNLWLHYMPKKKADRDEEIDWHVMMLKKSLKGMKAVLMMGDQNTIQFLDSGVMKLAGMEVKIAKFPKTIETITVSPNPAMVFKKPHGEVRLSIEKFAGRASKWL